MTSREFEVRIDGLTGCRIVVAESASKARYLAWIEINDVLPDVRLIDMKVKRHKPVGVAGRDEPESKPEETT